MLIVEDDESQLRTLTSIMQEEGFEVIGCSPATEAIEHLNRLKTGVVVLDLRLPDLSGTQLRERLANATDKISYTLEFRMMEWDSKKAKLVQKSPRQLDLASLVFGNNWNTWEGTLRLNLNPGGALRLR